MSRIPSGVISVSTSTVGGTYKDLADFNFAVEKVRGVFDGPRVSYPTAPRPGRLDSVLLNDEATGEVRELVAEGTVVSSSVSALTTDVRNLTGWCARAVALKTVHDSSTYLAVKAATVHADHFDVQGKQPACRVTITFRAVDPLWYATSASAVTFTSNTEMPLGTAPSRPVIRITGVHTNPTITYKDSSGATVTTLALTVTIAGAADYVEIDCGALTIVKSVSSVITDATDTLTSGDFIVLDPDDSDTVTPTWCSLSVSYGSGTPTALSTFRKAFY